MNAKAMKAPTTVNRIQSSCQVGANKASNMSESAKKMTWLLDSSSQKSALITRPAKIRPFRPRPQKLYFTLIIAALNGTPE